VGAALRSRIIAHTLAPAEWPLRDIDSNDWSLITTLKVNFAIAVVNNIFFVFRFSFFVFRSRRGARLLPDVGARPR
jgi:hypothetical protein